MPSPYGRHRPTRTRSGPMRSRNSATRRDFPEPAGPKTVTSDGVADREGRADRALSVVVVRGGHAEDRHHGVADELFDRPAVRFDDRRDAVECGVERRLDDLGIVFARHRRRANDVSEQNGYELALF